MDIRIARNLTVSTIEEPSSTGESLSPAVDLGAHTRIDGALTLTAIDGNDTGESPPLLEAELEVSADGTNWGTPDGLDVLVSASEVGSYTFSLVSLSYKSMRLLLRLTNGDGEDGKIGYAIVAVTANLVAN